MKSEKAAVPVTERDFRRPEFLNADPVDYERRADGAIVRKDRWETTVYAVAGRLGLSSRGGFECTEVIDAVDMRVRLTDEWFKKAATDETWFPNMETLAIDGDIANFPDITTQYVVAIVLFDGSLIKYPCNGATWDITGEGAQASLVLDGIIIKYSLIKAALYY